jgi:hypothetical protein
MKSTNMAAAFAAAVLVLAACDRSGDDLYAEAAKVRLDRPTAQEWFETTEDLIRLAIEQPELRTVLVTDLSAPPDTVAQRYRASRPIVGALRARRTTPQRYAATGWAISAALRAHEAETSGGDGTVAAAVPPENLRFAELNRFWLYERIMRLNRAAGGVVEPAEPAVAPGG